MPDTDTTNDVTVSEVKIPNMIVDFGNGADVYIVFEEEVYPCVSKAEHPALTAKLIELSEDTWTEAMANAYIRNFQIVSYYEAIDMCIAAGKSFAEAVKFLSK